ncbi:MAG: polysaccharide deacetylase family protein [Clostridia bacterium]|nr:polysaccharide deacetylase family protein [Clostridia bacterium]
MFKERKALMITLIVAGSILLLALLTVGFLYFNNYHIELTLNGAEHLTLEYGDEYKEEGATALLKGRWHLSDGRALEVTTEGTVDETTLGTYTLTYSAKETRRHAEAKRTVTIIDTAPPILTLKGEKKITVTEGEAFEEPGYVATDNYDGDLTKSVTVAGEVDTKKVGDYTLTYTVKDSSGNPASAERTVTVKEKPVVQKPSGSKPGVVDENTVQPGNKTIYLTFDDGPGPYTAQLLDILKKYNVKATFFVTNKPNYNHLLARMAAEGHAIGIHTASHTYKKIYASEEAFFADQQIVQDIIIEQTGKPTYLMRFPGGSSNRVSSFNKGIMTRLTQAVTEKGFRYFDWNVDSNDAGGATTSSQVAKNIKNGIAARSVSNVLQHDIKLYSVKAVEEVIKWGLDNGYTFKACDMTSPTFHHGINN